MTFITPTPYKTSGVYLAQADRRVLQTLAGGFEGIMGAGDLAVSADSPASMRVSVAAGRALVNGDSVARQGAYLIENDGPLVSPYAEAAHATLNRRDLIVARVYDPSPDGGSAASDQVVLEVITGVPGASPVTPAIPPSAIPLATAFIMPGATTITGGNLGDVRPKLPPPAPGGTGAALPLNPVDGQTFVWTPTFIPPSSGLAVWPMVYRSASGKWHSTGGLPAITSSAAGISTTNAASYTQTGLALTPPVSGTYDVEWMGRVRYATTVEFARLSISGGGLDGSLAFEDARAAAYQVGSNIDVPAWRLSENLALVGNLGVSLDYRSASAQALSLGFRYLSLMPRAVDAAFSA